MKFAKCISIIGHPLLTIPIFIAIVMFKFNDLQDAMFLSLLIIGCFFIPLILWMYLKSKNGTYTNFDVSDKKQRNSLFLFAVPLLLVVTIILFKTDQSKNLCLSVLFALILVVISQFVNLFIKSSLHVSLNIYLAALIFSFDYRIAIIVLLFTGLLCWSRVKLKRHTIKEVLFGLLTGTCISLIMLKYEGFIGI
jgi:membrane-associated phospholipid phosphatase